MSNELNLSMPERKPPKKAGSGIVIFLLLCILVCVGGEQVVLYLLADGSPRTAAIPAAPGALSADVLKDLALKYEKQGMEPQAVTAWKEYLGTGAADAGECASVWYRIGKLYQSTSEPALALDSYYRSEAYEKRDDIADDINRRSQECLAELGNWAASRYDLAERVGIDQSDAAIGDEIVAEIGAQKISQADLDRRMEAEIDRQIEQYAAFMPQEERMKQKDRLLKTLTSPQGRLQFVNQVVVEEVLYQQALERKLADLPEIRDLLTDTKRKLLAQKVMSQELMSKVNLTAGDVETYYQANKAQYIDPEKAHISQIVVATEDEAAAVRQRLEAGEAFDALAKELSLDDATKEKGGAVEAPVAKGGTMPGLGESAGDAVTAILATDADALVAGIFASEQGQYIFRVRERTPARQRSLEEVQQEVYQALRTQKEREVQEQLLGSLKDKYNVVIHQSKFMPEPAPAQTPDNMKINSVQIDNATP